MELAPFLVLLDRNLVKRANSLTSRNSQPDKAPSTLRLIAAYVALGLEALFLDETNALRVQAEELASAPVPFDALISWLRLQMDFAARGQSMGAAVMAAKRVPGTRSYAANKAMLEAGNVLLLRAQAAGHIRTDVHLVDVIRLVYGIVMVDKHASDPDGATRMLDLVIAGIRTQPSRD